METVTESLMFGLTYATVRAASALWAPPLPAGVIAAGLTY